MAYPLPGEDEQKMLETIKGAIFDLDGVIVDTAKYHYLAWKRLADELGFDFTEKDNERLKGVSRVRSLEILLEIGRISASDEEKYIMASKKNNWYVEYIKKMDETEIFKGAKEYLLKLRNAGVKVALGSASKNAPMILDNLKIIDLFDAIIDGNKVSKAKPDPEVFLLGAKELQLDASECVVFEDAEAGVEAAQNAGMRVVGIGNTKILKEADMVISGLVDLL
jgi:beta-phosphoglucomutase